MGPMREAIESFDVVGLPLRTSNREAARTIPVHWEAAAAAGLVGGPATETRETHETYAVYTDYESPGDDADGVYTLVIGRRAQPGAAVPDRLRTVTVPTSIREVVAVTGARPEQVAEAWAGIWARKDLERDYRADYECYGADGGIRLSVGVRTTP